MLIKIISSVVGTLMILGSTASIIYPYICVSINTCSAPQNSKEPEKNNTGGSTFVLVNTTGFGVPGANFSDSIECPLFIKSINFTYGRYIDSITINCDNGVFKKFGGNGGERNKLIEKNTGINNLGIIHGRVIDFIYDSVEPVPQRFVNRTVDKVCPQDGSVIKNMYTVYGVFIDYLKFTCSTK